MAQYCRQRVNRRPEASACTAIVARNDDDVQHHRLPVDKVQQSEAGEGQKVPRYLQERNAPGVPGVEEEGQAPAQRPEQCGSAAAAPRRGQGRPWGSRGDAPWLTPLQSTPKVVAGAAQQP